MNHIEISIPDGEPNHNTSIKLNGEELRKVTYVGLEAVVGKRLEVTIRMLATVDGDILVEDNDVVEVEWQNGEVATLRSPLQGTP